MMAQEPAAPIQAKPKHTLATPPTILQTSIIIPVNATLRYRARVYAARSADMRKMIKARFGINFCDAYDADGNQNHDQTGARDFP